MSTLGTKRDAQTDSDWTKIWFSYFTHKRVGQNEAFCKKNNLELGFPKMLSQNKCKLQDMGLHFLYFWTKHSNKHFLICFNPPL